MQTSFGASVSLGVLRRGSKKKRGKDETLPLCLKK
jgi:hypothetical protein